MTCQVTHGMKPGVPSAGHRYVADLARQNVQGPLRGHLAQPPARPDQVVALRLALSSVRDGDRMRARSSPSVRYAVLSSLSPHADAAFFGGRQCIQGTRLFLMIFRQLSRKGFRRALRRRYQGRRLAQIPLGTRRSRRAPIPGKKSGSPSQCREG